ncbi:MAG: aldo/keto reductase, partial [Myxococcales bacterium]|nr:aldo/keto reductase [Myxococcales bacterium]
MRGDEAAAASALDLLLEFGINHIDVAAGYGRAEASVGSWMPEHRKRFFLATKTSERTRDGAREQLERSLERLQTDRVDLIQLHNLTDEEGWETAFGVGGAVEALL